VYDHMLVVAPIATVVAASGRVLLAHGPSKFKNWIRVDMSMKLLADRCEILLWM
jgi:hypothetical protein